MIASLLPEAGRATAWLLILTIVFVPLERLFAERQQPVFRRQFGVDMGYFFLNSILTVSVLAAASGAISALGRQFTPGTWLAAMDSLPLWARVAATLAISEFGTYWGHRWSHEVPLLWRFHAIHHSAEQVDWLTSSRGHPVDLTFTRLCGLTLVCLAGLLRPESGKLPTAVLLASVFAIAWGFFVHANLRWRLGWLEWVVATPAFHRWHHTNDEHRDHNFASTLPVYDWLFGTGFLPARSTPAAFGIDKGGSEGLLEQLVEPVRPLKLRPRGRRGAITSR